MSAADRNKIIVAGGVAVIAIIVIVFFLKGRSARQSAGAGSFGTPAQQAAAQPGGAVVPGQAAPGAPGGAGVPAPGAQQVAAVPAEGVALSVGAIRMGSGPEERTRRDPFVTFDPPPAPVPPEVTANLPPVTLQAGGLRVVGAAETAGMVGRRRVAGLLFNDGAWAILEEDDRSFIVKPGDVVDGNRITAIGPDAIFVTDADGRRWRVNLRPLAPEGGGGASSTVPGMPAAPPQEF